ncbi:MAG: ribose-5-phosphate isomerase RpiA [Dehalococcoidia bacterium]|nr:ribose-5-phosphate isomerase RpiA [Dehalococcoidia bacterium]
MATPGLPATDPVVAAKRAAVAKAAEYIQDGMVLGLGTGSTVELLFAFLAPLLRRGWSLRGVPTSERTARLATGIGLPLLMDGDWPAPDLAIDGADEVAPSLDLIKGHGGALLREKVVAQAAQRLIIVVDPSKLVPTLGETRAVPIEVIPFAWSAVARRIRALGGEAVLRGADDAPSQSDNGNYLLDCHFGPITDPERLSAQLLNIAGVVDHGLFLNLTDTVIVGHPHGAVELLTKRLP